MQAVLSPEPILLISMPLFIIITIIIIMILHLKKLRLTGSISSTAKS